ncbi:uncharacterized protein LOC110683201 [Chenopodium quinoa]|uniref:uncharacterized protein LOC110683201 n=1 Tax=Chenopodium quinoa TaxID=63459 RepID=UPI000B7707D7|nr:uncharacterized protein LOC110683201 [Chenopodium quinoa]
MISFPDLLKSCGTIADILSRFGKASGQQINFAKSFIKFSPSVSLKLANSFKSILRVPIIDNMGKHLGVPIDLSGRKASFFVDLVECVKKKIMSWAHCKLSESAKLILINSVLLGMVAHVMKTCKLPMSISNKLDSLITRFWWAKSGEKDIHWINRMHTNPQLLAARIFNAKSDCILCPSNDLCKPPPASFSWNVGVVRDRFEWDSAQEILTIDLPKEEEEDFLYWPWHKAGTYTVKIKQGMPFLLTLEEGESPLIENKSMISIGFYGTWIFPPNGVSSSGSLLSMESLSELIFEQEELSLTPYVAIAVSRRRMDWIRSQILLFHSQDGIRSHCIQALVATLWAIWITRNKRIFQGENGFLQGSLGQLDHVLLFNDSLALSTIRVDGSWHKASKHYGVGWTIELQNHGEMEAGGFSGIAASALQTEFWACLYALRWASDNGYRSIKVFTDSALLVTAIRNKSPSDIHLFLEFKGDY